MIPTFTKVDLFVMLQTIGITELVGLSDPFKNLNKQEVEAEWEETYKSLHRRGLISLIDNEIELEERFADALWIMSRTNLTVEIVRDLTKKSLFYFGEENVIECTDLGNGHYTLYMHGEPSVTWNDVIYPRMLAGVEERPIQMEAPILFPTTLYNGWMANKKMPIIADFKKLNQDHHLKIGFKQLDKAIKQKIHNHRLMMFYKNNGQWIIEGMHVLTSPSANWVLKMVNVNKVELLEAKQSSNLEIVTEVLAVMHRIGASEISIP